MEQRCFFLKLKRMTMLDALAGASSVEVKQCIQECYLLLMELGECKPVAGVSMV